MHSSAAYQTSSDRTVFPTDRTLPALLRNEMTGVLTIYFGNSLPVEGWSEALGEAYVRRWPNFSAAADEAKLARIWAGIHFPNRRCRCAGCRRCDRRLCNCPRGSAGARQAWRTRGQAWQT